MKLALIVDNCRQESFELHDGNSYKFGTDIPYQFPHSIKNECHIGFWSYPKLLGDGCFIKLTDTELPNIDLDVILMSLELPNWQDNLKRVRTKYNNACIIGIIKEPSRILIEYFNQCDKVAIQYTRHDLPLSIPSFYMPQPIDINYLYDNFFIERKKLQLFHYQHHVHTRQGLTREFCEYISNKYNIPIAHAITTGDNTNQWRDFILNWRDSIFHVNLDPEYQFGQQACQTAVLGCINIGGHNDTNYQLYPNTATVDFNRLEHEISKYISDQEYMINTITNAWNMVNEQYSISSVANKLKENLCI
jgi:hypothetical protein